MTNSRKAAAIAVLRRAKAAVEEHGWQQDGEVANDAGQLSLDGALYLAGGADRPDLPTDGSGAAEGLVLDVLAARRYDGTVGDWNDEPGRSVDDVFALLDDTISHADAKNGA